MTLPDAAQYIMERISASGGVAYLVGGAVRDLLSGETPRDCDIATNLPPERVMSVFPNAVPTGIKHGTVTIPTPHGAVEVTTFRRDGSYSDNRRPDSVTWTDDLYEDLSRRDFTIGAMAMDIDGNLTDPFGGAADLKTRTIRAVGDPDTRFKEDALRMLRAFRFAARGYTIDPPTLAAIERNAHLAASLAPERVAQELRLTLESENPDTAFCLLSHNLLTPFLPNCDSTLVMPEACKAIFSQPCVVPEACLQASHGGLPPFLALACPGNSERAARALKLDAHTVADCRAIDVTPPPRTAADLKHLFCTLGDRRTLAVASCALKNFITEQYSGAHCVSGASRLTCRNPSASDMYAAAIEIIASGEPRNLSMLAVNGDDLAALGISGKKTGDTLRRLFDIVVADPTLNTKEYLLSVCANTQ